MTKYHSEAYVAIVAAIDDEEDDWGIESFAMEDIGGDESEKIDRNPR